MFTIYSVYGFRIGLLQNDYFNANIKVTGKFVPVHVIKAYVWLAL